MRALICKDPGVFEYKEIAAPEAEEGHALLRIRRIGICGTDLHAFEGTQPYFNYPRILGHELAGEIIDIGKADGFKKGDIVTFIPYFNCGKCYACLNDKPNCCSSLKVCGVHVDGGMVEYLSVPIPYLINSQGLDIDALALTEPLSIGAHGVRRAAVQPREFVLVIGAGPIGLGTMELARIAGGTVIALDINETRLQFCKEKLKIPFTINAKEENVEEQLKSITSGAMPAVVIDATGNLNAINKGFDYIAHGGRYVLIGLQKGNISFSHPEFHKREATLMSSRNATRQDFDHVIASIKKGLINPANYITHRVAFEKVKDEFASWLNPANGVIKAIVSMD